MYKPTTARELFDIATEGRESDEFDCVPFDQKEDVYLMALAVDAVNGCIDALDALEQDAPEMFDALAVVVY
jgi:hypothetical protein